MAERLLVTGAGGFIGHRLVKYLVAKGFWVRGADLKHPEFEPSPAHEFEIVDLRRADTCLAVARDVRQIYHLASDVEIGHIATDRARVVRNNTVMDVQILDAARLNNVKRFLFCSSAEVYPRHRRTHEPLREDDAWPADPEEGHGLEKLFFEKLCQYYAEDFGLETRVARLHNVYGPLASYNGGREKAPAAICRKVALAQSGGTIDVWGDGKQTRSFIYIDDCVEGLYRLMRSDCSIPLNLDTGEVVTLDEVVRMVAGAARKAIRVRHNRLMPQGVRGCSSDNALLRSVLGWTPKVSLSEGLARTYAWIVQQVEQPNAARAPASGRLRASMITAA
jgi:GDP-D-mannose 3',5'-epimerase